MIPIPWGAKVSKDFLVKSVAIARALGMDPAFLMACMAFESGESFSAGIRNAAGSGAVGLIQFMPQTAAALGTSTAALARMSAVQQLDIVAAYFNPWRGKLRTLEDVYMAILWPAAVGKPNTFVLFDKGDTAHPKRYIQNAGLDWNRDGKITKAEAAAKVRAKLEKGMLAGNVGAIPG